MMMRFNWIFGLVIGLFVLSASAVRAAESFPICTASGDQAIPQAAFNSTDNEYLVVWGDYREIGEGADLYVAALIYGQLVSADGTLKASEIPISAESSGTMRIMPAVSYSPDDNEYLVVYCKAFDLYGRFIGRDGSLRSEEFPICTEARFQMHPVVLYNPTQKNYFVLWNDSRAGAGQADIYGIFLNRDGTSDAGEFLICDAVDDQFLPVAAYNPGRDEFLVSWEDFRFCDAEDCYLDECSLYARRISSRGAFIGGEIAIAAAGIDSRQQRIAYNPDRDEYFVTWNDRRNDTLGGDNVAEVQNVDLYGRRIQSDGTILADFPLSTSPNSQSYSSIVYDPQRQRYLVTWNDYRDVDFSAEASDGRISARGENVIWDPGTIYAGWVDADGNLLGSDFVLSASSQGHQSLAYARLDNRTRQCFVVWSDDRRPSSGKDIYGLFFNPDETSVSVSSFSAAPRARKNILQWTTDPAANCSGFNIRRAEQETGEYTRINSVLLAPAEGTSGAGAENEFVDKQVRNRKTYWYKLESLDLNGQSTEYGPVSATPRLFYWLP